MSTADAAEPKWAEWVQARTLTGQSSRSQRMGERCCPVSLRWTPAHRGVEGNEVADKYARAAAESTEDATDRRYLRMLASIT